jgi:ABC-type multidrug transport system fused ATPase/permease subunit
MLASAAVDTLSAQLCKWLKWLHDAPQILLDGVDIRRLQLHFLRSQLGLVSQEPTLFATTIATNISYGKPGKSQRG